MYLPVDLTKSKNTGKPAVSLLSVDAWIEKRTKQDTLTSTDKLTVAKLSLLYNNRLLLPTRLPVGLF